MKVVITSYGPDCSDMLDPRFGRATYFMIYDDKENSWDCVSNQPNLEVAKGVGIQVTEYIKKLGANVIITGNIGPKAFKVLNANNVKVYSTCEISVGEAYETFKNGSLIELTNANVQGHWF